MNIDENSRKVILELLSYCNLNCQHCFYKPLNKLHPFDYLSKDKIFILIDKFAEDNINKLVLTGGEPTLHPNFIDVAKYAISKISKVSICTNGVISNKQTASKIVRLNFSTYTVSVDSHIDRVHDKFRGSSGALQKTISFLQKLKTNNKNISIHITIHPDNIYHIEDTIEFCKKFASEIVVGSIYHNKIEISGNKLKRYNFYLKKFKEKYANHPEIILVGFESFCKNKNCLDQKKLFMVSRKGELIDCYWKKDGGKVIKKY